MIASREAATVAKDRNWLVYSEKKRHAKRKFDDRRIASATFDRSNGSSIVTICITDDNLEDCDFSPTMAMIIHVALSEILDECINSVVRMRSLGRPSHWFGKFVEFTCESLEIRGFRSYGGFFEHRNKEFAIFYGCRKSHVAFVTD